MPDTKIELTIDAAVATACISTAGGLNVLSSSLLDRIAEVAAEVKRATGVRTLVLAAIGKVFVAGANIKELIGLDAGAAVEIARKGNRAFDAIADLPCVTIARLHGAALGGGLELALACDFRIATAAAKLGLPETSLGLVPGWKGIGRLSALAGLPAARRLVFSGEAITASHACDIGVVDAVVDDEPALDAKIKDLISGLKRGGPHAIAMAKRALSTGDELQAFRDCFDHAESKEGMTAFVEKRPARWMNV